MTDWDSIKAIATAFVDLADNTDDTDLSRLRKMAKTLIDLTQEPLTQDPLTNCLNCRHPRAIHSPLRGCLAYDDHGVPCRCHRTKDES